MAGETKQQRADIGSVFLKEFVRHLVINSKPKSSIDSTVIERVRARMSSGVSLGNLESEIAAKQPIVEVVKPSILPKVPLPRVPIQAIRPTMHLPSRKILLTKPLPHSVQQPAKNLPIVQGQIAQKPIEKDAINLGKLKPFLMDAGVTGVESPGPGKNVLVNRSGLVQASRVVLTSDEIDSILKEFSEKTKIPLIQGVFKALHSNLLITAVVSDSAGNRFIIEKHFGQPSLPKKEDVK